LYSSKQLNKLIRERGINLAHVYLDTFQTKGRNTNKTLLYLDKNGYRIRDDVDNVFRKMGQLHRGKKLWVTSMRSLGDYLTASREVKISYLSDGTALLTTSSFPIQGFSVSVQDINVNIQINGMPPEGFRRIEDTTIFWFDVEPNSFYRVVIKKNGVIKRLSPKGAYE